MHIKLFSLNILLTFSSWLTVFVLTSMAPGVAYASPYSLEIYKSSQQLLVKEGDEIIKRYRIASGKGGNGTKRQSGDNMTPLGSYRIMDFNPNSRFHFFMLLNYPNSVDAWRGYKNQLISARQFKEIIIADKNNILPPQNTSLGGLIGLHGIGEESDDTLSVHDWHNWTEGCVALTNTEIMELREFVSIGTTVLIKE